MICGEKKKSLTPETVLSLISEFDIYKMYVPDLTLNRAMLSPLRKENSPSFLISNTNGHLHFIDFATGEKGDSFTFVKLRYSLSLDEALHKIDQDFSLGISSGGDCNYKRIISQYSQPEELGKRYSLIQVVTRKFTKEDLEYWGSYFQTIDDLRNNNIYSLKTVYLNKKKFPLDDNLRFGYLYEGGWWKIYQPLSDRKRKWMGNVPLTMTYGMSNLDKNCNTLICKSLKDMLVCKKVYPNVMQVQNESLGSFSKETVEYINNNSKEVFLGFDADPPGKSSSLIITKTFGWKHINSPDRLLPATKDFSDWSKLEGLDVIREHFIKKGVME